MLSLIPEAGTPYPSSQETEKQPACSFSVRPNRLKRPLPSVAITGIYSPVMLGPNISGSLAHTRATSPDAITFNGPLYYLFQGNELAVTTVTTTSVWSTLAFDANRQKSIYNSTITVQPSALTVQYLIKY